MLDRLPQPLHERYPANGRQIHETPFHGDAGDVRRPNLLESIDCPMLEQVRMDQTGRHAAAHWYWGADTQRGCPGATSASCPLATIVFPSSVSRSPEYAARSNECSMCTSSMQRISTTLASGTGQGQPSTLVQANARGMVGAERA